MYRRNNKICLDILSLFKFLSIFSQDAMFPRKINLKIYHMYARTKAWTEKLCSTFPTDFLTCRMSYCRLLSLV